MKTCCEHHNVDCNQGRLCPERARRVDESALLRQCCASGQADSRQIAAHIAAGELLFPIGYESADPAHRDPVCVAREPLPASFAGKEPTDWQAVTLWAAVILCFTAVVALSIADPRDLSTLWPRMVSLVSF